MTFNKTEYRKNREAGKRGQGEMPEYPKPKRLVKGGQWVGKKRTDAEIAEAELTDEMPSGQHMVQIGTSLSFVSRKRARSVAAGTSKEKIKPAVYDPSETNHQRVLRQREVAKIRKEQARLRRLAEKDAE